ncbi:MAG: hypothetical protein KC733_01880, partial [Candidatus Omnitrophica bacterium]|nr:hypothetical protein [Candidatus Omnitrophota bacterium]
MIKMPIISFSKLRNQRGSALLFSYLVIVAILGIGSAFMLLSVNESQTAERHRLATVAFHIAEAGVERGLYDLRQDFVNAIGTPSWADSDINSMAIGPDTSNYYTVPYGTTTLNGGSYTVEFLNVGTRDMWVRSTGTIGGVSQSIRVYAKIVDISRWGNAIFGGGGASGTMVNGNVDIRGSVHILGDNLLPGDVAIDLGGTAQLVGNNYTGLNATLQAKVPALPTVNFNGEIVETLNAELRVKQGSVGLSGSATVGEADVAGNNVKETVDGVYVTDGYGGTQGSGAVYSDNSVTTAYDLGDAVKFPRFSDPSPYNTSITNQQYLYHNALVISNSSDLTTLANINPSSSFSFSGPNGSISMDGSGNMTVSGIVYIDGGEFNLLKNGSDKTITYTGTGSIVATGDVHV